MRGRKPVPKVVRQLKGMTGAAVVTNPPECPGWLSPYAKEEWHRVAPLLASRGLLLPDDQATFAGYCQAYAIWRQATEMLQLAGLMSVGSTGQPKVNDLAKLADQQLQRMMTIAAEFGFTPVSRTKLDTGDSAPEVDEFDSFLRNGESPHLPLS